MLNADAVLVMRCQKDDCEAFDEIVARYKDGIYNYVWRMVSNRDDAEDLAQEVFVRAFASIKAFRREANLRTWLYKIASNLCVDRYRRAGLENKWIVPLEREQNDSIRPLDIPDHANDPRRSFERSELRTEVRKALLKLPDKLRSAIVLFDIEGLSYEEIAEALACPIGTVKSRIFNARLKLRELLKGYVEGGL